MVEVAPASTIELFLVGALEYQHGAFQRVEAALIIDREAGFRREGELDVLGQPHTSKL